MEFLDCRGCSQPLRSPFFQCFLGHPHFLCSSCCDKFPESKCKTCAGVDFERCPAMEDAVNRVLLPCKHGCGENITYYSKEGHENVCQEEGPCFCPEPGCGFRGQTTALFDHFTTHHKWPGTNLKSRLRFDVQAVPGIQVLRRNDGQLFLLKVASLESHVLKVSLVSVQVNTENPAFTCSFSYQWRSHHFQNVWLDKITNSSLSDGLPEDCSSCVLPSVLGGVTPLLNGIFIENKFDDEGVMEWEDDDDTSMDEDDDDTSIDEDEDDDDEADDHTD